MLSIYEEIKEKLNKYPFLTIIGKFHQVFGPKMLYSSHEIEDER